MNVMMGVLVIIIGVRRVKVLAHVVWSLLVLYPHFNRYLFLEHILVMKRSFGSPCTTKCLHLSLKMRYCASDVGWWCGGVYCLV